MYVDLVRDIDNINSIKHCLWKQTAGIPITIDDVKDKLSFSFTAPYVTDDDFDNDTTSIDMANTTIPPAYSKLSFQLTIADNDGKTKDAHYNVDIIVKRVQRAIIFQGGVALGAYEAGVFHALVKKLSEQDEDKRRRGIGKQKRPLFDIVAGTSIGGMNAAVVISSIRRGDSWQDSAQKVIKFWRDQEYPLPIAVNFWI